MTSHIQPLLKNGKVLPSAPTFHPLCNFLNLWGRKGESVSMFSFSSIDALQIFSFTSWTHFPTNSLADKRKQSPNPQERKGSGDHAIPQELGYTSQGTSIHCETWISLIYICYTLYHAYSLGVRRKLCLLMGINSLPTRKEYA